MKLLNNIMGGRLRLSVLIGLVLIFTASILPVYYMVSKPSTSYAQDDEEEEFADEEAAEEEGLDPEALIAEGYIQHPEILSNPDNPNVDLTKPAGWDIPIGKFSLFGLSNRDITWILAALHILFASFILAGPLFIVVFEACGAEKKPGVRFICAVITTLAGLFAGSVVGMIGEVMLEAHGALEASIYAGTIGALVVSIMVLMGAIGEEGSGGKGTGVGAVVGLIVAGIVGGTHLNVLILGLVSGLIGGVASSAIIYAKPDAKLERLAHELMKVVAVCYSFTALTGGFFLLLLVAFFPSFITWLTRGFSNLVTVWYPIVFVIETIFMYLYYYTWDTLSEKKHIHIFLGLLLNIAGISLLILMDGPASFMLTPAKPLKEIATLGEWAWINNFTWWPLNFHRLVGNLTYGGFIVGFVGALMYMWSTSEEDKEYYDWQGYLGNALGLAFMLPLPIMGYIYAKEVYAYDAAIGMYIMSDRLSMFMLMQAVLIGFLFVGANLYMWISVKRVEGHEKYLLPMKVGFVLLFGAAAVWYAPRHFFATMMLEPGMIPAGMTKDAYMAAIELPGNLSKFALMGAKVPASGFMLLITLVNYILYRVACKRGKIAYGKVNPLAQYVLVFLAFSDIWLMTLMGGIRELARKNFHVYKVMKDLTVDAFTPTLAYSAKLVTVIVWIFFIMITAIVWLQLKYTKSHGKAGH
ncbi:MAG: cytochrome ubiquinol oxidase subunit I [Thermodesulfobacteriota bacterium]